VCVERSPCVERVDGCSVWSARLYSPGGEERDIFLKAKRQEEISQGYAF
jgi:hypothetical protein